MMLRRMPRLSTFHGIVIYMYVRDHAPAHVHAWYGSDRAVVEVASGMVIAGTLQRRQAGLVKVWIDLHREELTFAWRRASLGTPPGTIEPLP